jgi:TRAP transporter TAXI family solute receptor
MNQQEMSLTFQSDIVWPWGLFFSEFAEFLSGELPALRKAKINLVLGDFLTPMAVANKDADVGFVTPPACITMAFKGIGPYTKKMENLRAIGALPHDDRMLWAVPADSAILDISDMKDHPLRLVIPSKDFPVRFAVERVLEAYGTSIDELQRRDWQIIEESHCLKIPSVVIEGRADALVHEGLRTPAWLELRQKRQMRYLSIDEAILRDLENQYGYRRAVISKGMVPGIEDDVPCVDFSDWLLFTRDDMPDDFIYLMTKMLIEKRERLFEFHFRNIPDEACNLVCPIDPKLVWKNVGGISLHKGAERYYREVGYM